MKPRILLTGKGGQVGGELSLLLSRLGELTAVDRGQLDLSKPEQIRETVRSIRPQLIVNAAAYTAVDKAESEQALAQAINTDAPGVLAEEAARLGALLVHYSTDYVFDGAKREPYLEDDPANPQNAYGRTKLAGEQAIRQSGARHLIFRTEWVYGRSGRNFLLTILRLASQREELRIVRDQIGAPTWSHAIAAATADILSRICEGPGGIESFQQGGIYHMTAGGQTTWYDFAQAILDYASRPGNRAAWVDAATEGRPLIAHRIIPITTAEFPTPASRPAYSVLSNRGLKQTFGVRLPDWQDQLHSVFSE